MRTPGNDGKGAVRRSPLALARATLAWAERPGGDVEVYAEYGRTVTVKVFAGEVESVAVAEPCGVGVRAVAGGRTGYVFTTDVSDTGLARVAAGVWDALEAADVDPLAGLPGPPQGGYPVLDGLWHPGVAAMALEDKTCYALEGEGAAMSVRGVETVEEAVYADEEAHVAIASSTGIEAEAEQSYAYVYVFAHAGEGADRQSGLGFTMGREPGVLDPSQAGVDAGRKAAALCGARPCPTGFYTVVFDREVAAALFAGMVQALSADAVQKQRSVFGERLDTAVASPLVQLFDDGLAAEGLATSPFDGEGVPQQTTRLIEGGTLRSYLYDSRAARRGGRKAGSTGNAVRASYRTLPRVGASNLVVAPGSGSLEELLARVGNGLYVESVAGLHSGVNAISGEISLGVTGRMIVGGGLDRPVREVTIATDFLSLLGGVTDLAGDGRWSPFHGSVYAPAVAVRDVTVSGADGNELHDK